MSILVRRNRNDLTKPLRSIMSDLFDNDRFLEGEFYNGTSIPAVNVKETEDNFEIELAVPGMKKDDFKIEVENGVLSISGEKEEKQEEKKEQYTRQEFSYSSFSRSFTLPDNVDEDNIKANYKEGVLGLQLAKKEVVNAQPVKAIDIN